MRGKGGCHYFRRLQAACCECFGDPDVIPSIGTGQYPRLFGKLRNVNFSSANPTAFCARHCNQFVIEKKLDVQIVPIFNCGFGKTLYLDINSAFLKSSRLGCERYEMLDVQHNAWIGLRETVNHRRKDGGCN